MIMQPQFKKRYLFLLMLMFSFTSCIISQNLPVPNNTLPASYRGAALTDTGSIATLKYADFFQDRSMIDLIDSAVANNYDMQIALKNIDAAALLFRQSKLGNLPALSLNISANSNRPSDNSLNGLTINQFAGTTHVEDYNASASLSWEADIWKKISNQKNVAGAAYLQSEEARKAVQTRLVSDIAIGFYNLIMLDTQLAIAKKNLALNDTTLNIIRLQFNSGQVTSLAIQQAEAQRQVAAGLVPQLEQYIALQENALSILTGVFPGTIRRQAKLNSIAVNNSLSAGIPSEMLSLRPDVRSAELELQKANARVGISRANMYPSLTISASGGLNAFKASEWFNIPGSLFGIVAGGITQPVFQRRQLRTQYELAAIDREKSVLQFRSTVLHAVSEVADELTKIRKLDQQYAISDSRVKIVQEGLRNANLLFKSGLANYLEVVTAQANALQSELDLTAIKTAQLNANVGLYRTLGGGWK
jgi:NodT family efflux transporter outer membrane factor (OMF) lipoprotein